MEVENGASAGSSSSRRGWGLGLPHEGWGLEAGSAFSCLELGAVPPTPSTVPVFQNRQEMQEVPFIFYFQGFVSFFHKSVLFLDVSKYALEHSGNQDIVFGVQVLGKRPRVVQDLRQGRAGAGAGGGGRGGREAGSEGSTLGLERRFAIIRSCLIRIFYSHHIASIFYR